MTKEAPGFDDIAQKKSDYEAVFKTPEGKRVLEDLERICFINRTTFPSDSSPTRLAFHEGQRFVIVTIRNMINMNLTRLRDLIARGD